MNPEERQELARLVPSPGDPVLPSDRYDLLKDHLMREITPQVQNTFDVRDVQGVQDARLAATVATPRRTAARPGRRFAAIAVPLAAAVTAAVVIGTGITDTRATDPEAVDLLNRIATVAAAKRAVPVRDDQYVYIRTQGSLKITDKDIRIFRDSRWTAVDGKRPGLSRITVLQGPPPRPRDPFSAYAKGTRNMTLYADPNVTTFREMEALPNDPDALLKKIYADSKGEGQTRQSAALETIGDMLDGATLLPELDAALYRAAAKIPGVSVVESVKDLAGRSGIGLSFKNRDDRDVWVFDKKSLTYLGSDKEALLGTGVTDKRGEEPGN
ncbi:CU044_5270 family protein [Streptomyces sp. NPDC097610]|uniref:CU044_5270 family protein n=1 Tax=Streptomyces sp. NPDC097610 TaxID=3157227 RepID=UPI00331CD366